MFMEFVSKIPLTILVSSSSSSGLPFRLSSFMVGSIFAVLVPLVILDGTVLILLYIVVDGVVFIPRFLVMDGFVPTLFCSWTGSCL